MILVKKRVTDNYFEKKLDFESKSFFVTEKICYNHNIWLTGVYMACISDRNSGRQTS